MELLDCVAAKFYEEPGVFKLLVSNPISVCPSVRSATYACIKRCDSCLLSNAPDSGLNHGFVPSGLQWTWGTGRSTAETGSDALTAAEDIRG